MDNPLIPSTSSSSRRVAWCAVLLMVLVAPPLAAEWRMTEVAPGVWAALQPSEARFNDSNSTVIVTDRDVVVVDAQASSESVEELVEWIRARTELPVRFLVYTHWHGDHTQGGSVHRDAWGPGLEIVGHATHGEDIQERTTAALAEDVERWDAAIAAAREQVESRVDGEGEPMDDEAVVELQGRIERSQARVDAMRAVDLLPPTISFDERLVLERETGPIVLHHFRGHTRGDVVVHLPEQKVLITGDILDEMPFGGHGYPSEWIDALDAMERLDFDRIVPGHGGILAGKESLVRLRDLLRTLVDEARGAVARGEDLEALRARIDLTPFRAAMAGDDETAGRAFDQFVPELVERAWLEASGEPLDPPTP